MSQEIPEYYRHLATQPQKEDQKPSQPTPEKTVSETPHTVSQRRASTGSALEKRTELPGTFWSYNAHAFTIALPEDWKDKTVFTLTGPVTDGIQHNVTITSQKDLSVDNLLDFAEWQIRSLKETLKGCRLLLKESIEMDSGPRAYRAIFVWWPTEDLRLYQEQLYVLHEKTGYTLTASFTKKTRKTLGPQIERAMLSFTPIR